MKKHISDFFLNSVPFFTNLLPTIIAIPIYIKTLGSEGLGIYYLYLAVVGIGGTFDFGIPQTIIKYISEYREKSKYFIKLTIYSTKLITTLSNVFLLIVGLVFSIVVYYTDFFNGISVLSIVLFTTGIILQTWFNFFLSILKGYEKFKKVAVVEAQNKLLFTTLGVFMAIYLKDVNYVILSHIFSLVLQNILLMRNAIYFRNRYSFGFKLSFFKDKLWNYSKWILTQNTIGFLNSNVDKFVVASFISLSSLSVYNTAKNIANLLPAFYGKGMSYILPYISKARDRTKIKQFYIKYSYIFNTVLALSYILGIIFSAPVLFLYLKDDIELAKNVIDVFRFLLISSVFASTSLLSYNLFNGIGEVKINTVIPFFSNIISILLICVFGFYYGFWGVVFARMNNVFLSVIVRTYTYNKVFKENDYLIGLKMSLPLLFAIVLIELIYF